MSRIVFILISAFWVAMNLLLWRAEYGPAKGGTAVSAETIWEKVLTAPDDSSLNVMYQGKRIGFCRWRTGVGDAWAKVSDENIPSGLHDKTRGYNLRAEGSVILEESANRIRFEADLQLGGKHELRQMKTRVAIRPTAWDIVCVATNQTIELSVIGENGVMRRTFNMADLQSPMALVSQLIQPFGGDWLPGISSGATGPNNTSTKIEWDATTDWTQIGHTSVQIYKMHTRLLQRFDVNMLVSRAGEILRIELPNDVTLVNDQLHSL